MVRAREKEDKTNQARESDNETKKPYRGERESRTTKQRSRTEGSKRVGQRNKESRTTKQRETNNETKRAGQVSEAAEHPLTFGYYVNIQISNLRKERQKGWNWNE